MKKIIIICTCLIGSLLCKSQSTFVKFDTATIPKLKADTTIIVTVALDTLSAMLHQQNDAVSKLAASYEQLYARYIIMIRKYATAKDLILNSRFIEADDKFKNRLKKFRDADAEPLP